MKVDFEGHTVLIPRGYTRTDDGTFMNGHGVEYALAQYGWKDNKTICLETIYSDHVRTVECETV